jgi:hypothetical protein
LTSFETVLELDGDDHVVASPRSVVGDDEDEMEDADDYNDEVARVELHG